MSTSKCTSAKFLNEAGWNLPKTPDKDNTVAASNQPPPSPFESAAAPVPIAGVIPHDTLKEKMKATLHGASRPLLATRTVKPTYPEVARKFGIQGPVDVTVHVDSTGNPTTLSAAEGNKMLQKAALDAATDLRFRPAEVDGKPVPSTFHIRFEFRIPQGWSTRNTTMSQAGSVDKSLASG